MMSRTLTLSLLLAVPVIGIAQGKLEQVRDAVDHPSTPKDKDSTSSDNSDNSASNSASSSSGSGSSEPFPGAFLLFPWTVPHALLDSGSNVHVRFTSFPFVDTNTRYIVLDRQRSAAPSYYDRADTQWWSVRASAEAGSDFNGLDRVGLRLFLDSDTRIGLKSDWDYYSERLPAGRHDQMWFGDLTPTFRFVQNEWLMMQTGLGLRFMFDRERDHTGVNFLYSIDAFPIKPLHLFGSFEAGTLGHADLYRLRGGVGVNWTHAELFAGYDFLRIGGVNLQGPMMGLRLWF
jgi:hypothetical protein